MNIFSISKIILAVLLLTSAQWTHAQPTIALLSEGKLINAKIAGAKPHRYNLALKSNQFAKLQLFQKGLDLRITTFDPLGNTMQEFDLTGNFGEEIATITAKQSGNYTIEVQPFADTKEPVAYSLELLSVDNKALTPADMVDQYLAKWDSTSSPGLAIAVVKNGEIVHSNGFGQANLEYNIPIANHTVFEVASISKQFTAFSILLLAEEGKLAVNDKINKHLPELPAMASNITLEHLLHHTSGLREQGVLRAMAGWRDDDIATQEQAFTLLKNQRALNFVPGELFEYSNSGYFLLAKVVERVSGQSFAAFTQQRIFQPLGMQNSAFPVDYLKVINNKAYSYRITNNGFAKSLLNSNMIGSTGLTTTVVDLAKWASNFEDPKVGNVNIVQRMKTTAILNSSNHSNYAYGQVVDAYQGIESIGHGGTIAGYKTYLLRLPSQHLSVIVLANLPYINPLNTAYEIARFYLPQARSAATPKIAAKALQRLTGDFDILGGIRYTVTQVESHLYLQIMGGTKQLLTHLGDNEFSFGQEGRKLRLGEGTLTMFEGIYGGQRIEGTPISATLSKPKNNDLTEFTGRYYSQELDTNYDIKLENNQLIAQNLRNRVYLQPLVQDGFTGNRGYFLRAHFVRNSERQITGFEVTGTLIDRLKFSKVNGIVE